MGIPPCALLKWGACVQESCVLVGCVGYIGHGGMLSRMRLLLSLVLRSHHQLLSRMGQEHPGTPAAGVQMHPTLRW